MPVIRKKVWVPLVIIVAAGLFLFLDARWLPSHDEARELATETFERYAKQEKIDLRLFEGPTNARNVNGVAYAFQWTYSDEEGKLSVLVLVDRGAWAKISFDVDDSYDGSPAAIDKLDRLMQRVQERSRGTR
ncbi:MAG: hypothetical protein AB7N53_14515 [Candidatus Binatia bacterium]